MEYIIYFVNLFYDGLENFFKSFTIVNGKATLRVLLFSTIYLAIALITKITNVFTFIEIEEALLAFILLVCISCISVVQGKDIAKFKSLLKGDVDDE